MGILKRLFGRNKNFQNTPPRVPTWEEVVETMFDKDLNFTDEIIKVIYGKDRAKRYVLLKSDVGYYTFCYEELFPFDEDELCYFNDGRLGYWQSRNGIKHFFDSAEHALRELMTEPEYKNYFMDSDE